MTRKQILIDLVLNALLPWLFYSILTNKFAYSEFRALLLVTVIPAIVAFVGVIRKGRPDTMATISLISIALSIAMVAVSNDTRALQVRESYLTGLIGLVFIGSCLIKRPIIWILAAAQVAEPDHKRNLSHPRIKRMLSVVTAVWGWSFVLEFALKLWMIHVLSIERVLFLSPLMLYAVMAVTFAWTWWWMKKEKQKTFLLNKTDFEQNGSI